MIDPLENLTNFSESQPIIAKIGEKRKLRVRDVEHGIRAYSASHGDIF